MRTRSVILFLATFLAAFGLNAYSEEETAPSPQNAAEFYNKAFDMMAFIESEQILSPATTIIRQGWHKYGSPDLEKFLNENKECLAVFAKGLPIEKCDFTFGEPKVHLFSGISKWNKSVWNMSCLVLLTARRAEHNANLEMAVEMYLAELKFMEHVAQGRPTMDKIVALNCEGRTLQALQDCLKKHYIDRKALKKLAAGLEGHEKRHYPVQKILDDEKAYYLFVVQWVADQLVKDPSGEENDGSAYGKTLLQEARRCADEFYELGSKACASDSDESWEAATTMETELRKKGKAIREKVSEVKNFIDLARSGTIPAPELAEMMLGLYLSSPKGMMRSLMNNLNRLKELRAEVSIR